MTLFVTYCTPEYENEALQCKQSAKCFGLDLEIYRIPSTGSWVGNCARKSEIVQKALSEHKRSVVWIDADARVRQMPQLLLDLPQHDYVHFGAYFIPDVWNQSRNKQMKPWTRDDNHALASGTLYFKYSDMTINLVNEWNKECVNNPHIWDQQSLQKVWDRCKYDEATAFLPQSYCKVFDAPWFRDERCNFLNYKTNEPVIEHMQASRKLKAIIR
jgi:hypothetical protein